MIHRDLKPQNVLLDCTDASQPPIAKIADFGESRDESKGITMTYVGTQWYIAPEIFRGERYSNSADIFSLGVVLNQIDTLQPPGTGVNFNAMNARNPGSYRPLLREGVPNQILAILKACMQYDNGAEHGVEGDLTFGRPSISSLLNMVSRLADQNLRTDRESKKERACLSCAGRKMMILKKLRARSSHPLTVRFLILLDRFRQISCLRCCIV